MLNFQVQHVANISLFPFLKLHVVEPSALLNLPGWNRLLPSRIIRHFFNSFVYLQVLFALFENRTTSRPQKIDQPIKIASFAIVLPVSSRVLPWLIFATLWVVSEVRPIRNFFRATNFHHQGRGCKTIENDDSLKPLSLKMLHFQDYADWARYLHIPLCNMPSDPAMFAIDLFYTRHLTWASQVYLLVFLFNFNKRFKLILL